MVADWQQALWRVKSSPACRALTQEAKEPVGSVSSACCVAICEEKGTVNTVYTVYTIHGVDRFIGPAVAYGHIWSIDMKSEWLEGEKLLLQAFCLCNRSLGTFCI